MRTTSSVESLNSQLNRSFPKRGHLWKFIEQLQYHEFSKANDMLKLTKIKVSATRKRKRDKERERKIVFLTKLLKQETISVGLFYGCYGKQNNDSGHFCKLLNSILREMKQIRL